MSVAPLDRGRGRGPAQPRTSLDPRRRARTPRCGNPDVVTTEPRLDDGTPFPTTFYLTCPRAASLIGTLEADGLMRQMSDRLAADADLAASYAEAHRAYGPPGPRSARCRDRRCLGGRHARPGEVPARAAGQSLAQGRGVNPLGDEVRSARGLVVVRSLCAGGRMIRVAAIDCGTNTIKLLSPTSTPRPASWSSTSRDADGPARSGCRPHRPALDAALQRVFGAIDEYAAIVAEDDVERAGSVPLPRPATRTTPTRSPLRRGTARRHPRGGRGRRGGPAPYDGATRPLAAGLAAPYLVVDIGGGSPS